MRYGNIVWASTSREKLKKIASEEKQILRIENKEHKYVREIMIRTKVLNIYKLSINISIDIYQVLNFMFKIKANTALCIFENQFTEIHHFNVK